MGEGVVKERCICIWFVGANHVMTWGTICAEREDGSG